MALLLRDLVLIPLAETHIEVDAAQLTLAFTALMVALGIPTIMAARTGRQNKTKLEDLHDQADTGNGHAIGPTVRGMAEQQEVITAQLHTNTQEAVDSAQKAAIAAERASVAAELDVRVEGLAHEISRKLDEHLIDAAADRQELREHLEESKRVHERLLAALDLQDRREEV